MIDKRAMLTLWLTQVSGVSLSSITELRSEHEALEALSRELKPPDLERRSMASEWTIAQVFSHLGSGAEINTSNLRGSLGVDTRIPPDSYPELWRRWDALPPTRQVDDFRRWHSELVERFEEIQNSSAPERTVETVMGNMPASRLAGIRLREAALHRWDIAAALDPAAGLRPASGTILLDQLPEMTSRLADPGPAENSPVDSLAIHTTEPDRSLVLTMKDQPTLTFGHDRHARATLELSGESLVLLFYGRLTHPSERTIREHPPDLIRYLQSVFKGL